jgi:ArsR family transcriptional regulator, arsenate/arsenite/antimonite-responsive transcriptional repressor
MSSNVDAIAVTFTLATPLFFALGEPARQRIILVLAEVEALNVGELTSLLPLSRPAISHHLKVLKQAGLVTVVQRGTENRYSLAFEDALALLKRFAADVEACT